MAPVLTSFTGGLTSGSTGTVTGSGFGSKANAKTQIWCDFSAGTLNPTSLGLVTTWNATLRIAASQDGPRTGLYCAKSTSGWESDNTYLSTGPASLNYGSKLFINFWRKVTYSYAPPQNRKFIRIWKTTDGTLPDWYIGTQVDGSAISYVEDLTVNANSRQTIPSAIIPSSPNVWRNEEYVLKLNSANAATDGHLEVNLNCVNLGMTDVWQTDNATRTGQINNVFIQDDPSSFTSDGNVYFDDIYIDTAWERVVIGNAATYAACTKREIQIPSAWTDTSITFTANMGTFNTTTDTLWAYVVDGNNVPSSTGFKINAGRPATSTSRSFVSKVWPSILHHHP